jgi:hypothetical protein
MKNALALAGIIALGGCYTQLATVDRTEQQVTPPENAYAYIDSAGDTVRVVERTDTVVVEEREVCYWARDFWGRPELRCYETRYDDDWHRYYHYPWWYSSYGDFDYFSRYRHYGCHCPYHTYYHPNCRYCWDRCNHYCWSCADNNDEGGGVGGAAPAVRRRPTRYIHQPENSSSGSAAQKAVSKKSSSESRDSEQQSGQAGAPSVRSRRKTRRIGQSEPESRTSSEAEKKAPAKSAAKSPNDTSAPADRESSAETKESDDADDQKAPDIRDRRKRRTIGER